MKSAYMTLNSIKDFQTVLCVYSTASQDNKQIQIYLTFS